MRVGPGLRLHLGGFYLFLYLPIAVLVVLSFNRSGLPTAWTGFSTEWYGKLAANPAVLRATLNSLIVAAAATVLATVLGTALAIGVEARRKASPLLDGVMLAPMIIPDIVLAIALLVLFTLLKFTLGLHSIVLAHTVFDLAFVTAVVRTRLKNFERSLVEASIDLGASQLQTLRHVILPIIAPGILAAALLAFTLSIDEFVIAWFTAGAGRASTTLPMQIYSMIRFGVTPEINALATLLMAASFTLVLLAQRFDPPGR